MRYAIVRLVYDDHLLWNLFRPLEISLTNPKVTETAAKWMSDVTRE